jgi:hypothetical protein
MLTIGAGHGATAAKDVIPITVPAGGTVNISNLSGDALNYFQNGLNQPATILQVGRNVNLTRSVHIQSQGVSTIFMTGGPYGT